jgi:hypothetical protein
MSIPIRKRIAAGTFIGMPTFFLCCVFVLASYASEKGHPNIHVEPFETFVNETIQVKAREYVHYTLQLNKGTTLHAKFIVSGGSNNKADVWLLDSSNYQLFRNKQQFMYYDGTSMSVRGVAGYSFTIPKTDNYELVIDNTKATKYSRTVSLYVYGIFPQPTSKSEEIAQAFQQIYDGFKQAFIFKDFKISLIHCGFENAFSDPNITICIELIEDLANKDLDSALAFILFHELGHTLLRDWGLPLSDNEDVQDEFATVLCLMAEAKESATAAAQFWANLTSEEEALSKLYIDDRHTISPQRARNIVNWISQQDELLRRWQKMLIPNMQSDALRELDKETDPWISHELIRSELKRRQLIP